ncbi:beta-mannosidase [Gordonia sp. UCD-TK1]|uniref:beta-mannosidase n=1 Tax=Gordonia sp. UCD-TK1 TaxID=1857893 RepID=UPI0009F3D46B|nr:beta-mannosidase [Gordonia sp. UCD-TK1]
MTGSLHLVVRRRTHKRAVGLFVTAIAVVVLCLAGCARTPDPGPPQITQSHRASTTPTGLVLDGKPWWPAGFNAYQLSTDWSVNRGCGAQVDADGYFDRLPPRALTRFNLYSVFAVDKRSGLIDFGPIDRVFQAAARHHQMVLPVLTGGSGDCEDERFEERDFYVDGWQTEEIVGGLTYTEWVEIAVTRWHDEQSIAGWELVGEPEASECGPASCDWEARTCPDDATAVLRSFFDRAGAHLRAYDADRPIFSGVVGGDQCGLAGAGYAEVLGSAGVDVLDFHDYRSDVDPESGPAGSNLRARLAQARELGKPLVVNEIGIHAGSCGSIANRAEQFETIIARHRDAGVAGALLWSFVPDPRGAQCTYDIGLHDPAWNVVREYAS